MFNRFAVIAFRLVHAHPASVASDLCHSFHCASSCCGSRRRRSSVSRSSSSPQLLRLRVASGGRLCDPLTLVAGARRRLVRQNLLITFYDNLHSKVGCLARVRGRPFHLVDARARCGLFGRANRQSSASRSSNAWLLWHHHRSALALRECRLVVQPRFHFFRYHCHLPGADSEVLCPVAHRSTARCALVAIAHVQCLTVV